MYHSNSFNPIEGEILFVGNAVPKFSGDNGFYYLHNKNSFWKLLDYIFFNNVETFEKLRKEYTDGNRSREITKKKYLDLLKEKRIGLIDVIKSCENLTNSKDSGILKDTIVYNDELEKYVNKATIVFINGKTTFKNFKKALGNKYDLYVSKCITLVSSSNAASIKNKQDLWRKAVSPYI